MPEIEIELKGLDEAIQRFDANIDRVINRGTRAAVELIKAHLASYPPKILGSSYDRTGNLGRAWAARVTGMAGNVVGIVGNTMPYAPYVQDLDVQAAVHRGRWPTVQGVAEKEAENIADIYQTELDRELED